MSESTNVDVRSYITFKLGDELFAIDVSQVREVLDLSPVTRIPSAPSYVRGVVNVRGTAIPVADLRLKFGLSQTQDTHATRILVLELLLDGELAVVGGLADSVHHVLEIHARDIKEAPRVAMRWRSDLVSGISNQGDDFIIILDIARLFALDGPALTAEALASLPVGESAEATATGA